MLKTISGLNIIMIKILITLITMFFLTCCSQDIPPEITETTTATQTQYVEETIKNDYPQLTNLPTLYIELNDNQSFENLNKNDFIQAIYTLVDGNEVIYEQPLEIKGRGNYSWSLPKKPYALKLNKRTDLLNMGDAKRWVLIANHSDKTLMRNYLTLTFAYDLGLKYTPECRYVDLYTNGQYHGNYLLTEKIQIHENRVDIDKEHRGLFEIEIAARHGGQCRYCIDVPSGVHIMFVDPDEDDTTPEDLAKKLIEFKSFFTAVDISLGMGYDEYSKYIDVESFIDWYLVNEFVKNYDSGFTTSCYCFIDNSGKLNMGPVWDYDTCMGNQEVATCINPRGYHVNGSAWFGTLTNDVTFKNMLHKRWTQLRNDGVIDDFVKKITTTAEYISESEKLDHAIWPEALTSKSLRGDKSKYTFDEEVDYLIYWVVRRIEWLDIEWYKNTD